MTEQNSPTPTPADPSQPSTSVPSTPDPSQSNTSTPTKPDPSQPSAPPPSMSEGSAAKVILLFIFLIPIITFFMNAIFVTIILGIFIPLSVSFFEPIITGILKPLDNLLDKGLRSIAKTFKWSRTSSRSLKRRLADIATVIAIVLLIITYNHGFIADRIGALNDISCLHGWHWPTCSSGVGVSSVTDSYGSEITIGLVTQANKQDLPFDTSHVDPAKNELDVEKKIFAKDDQACASSHITLAIATTLSRTTSDNSLSANVGLQDLRGAYLAQKDYNDSHDTKICLVIANLGTKDAAATAVPQVVRQILLFAHSDPTFRGIVGLPFSVDVKNAADTFKMWPQSNISVVASSATSDFFSSDTFSKELPNFHRVVSPDKLQSQEMADFINKYFITALPANQPKPKIAVFSDVGSGNRSPDPYSNSLSDDFSAAIQKYLPVVISENYKIGEADSIDTSVKDAIINQHANYIFFAGFADDLNAVEASVQAAQQTLESAPPIPIFGGDGLYDLTRYIGNPYSIVYSTAWAPPLSTNDPFVADYNHTFTTLIETPYMSDQNYTLIPPHVILSYDATNAMLTALNKALIRGDTSQGPFNDELSTIQMSGVTGNIQFQQNSVDPNNRSVYVLCADRNHTLHVAMTSVSNAAPSYPPLQDIQQCK
jgi:ABC-type branched-subunit amino acid transport system substrate-binding protein